MKKTALLAFAGCFAALMTACSGTDKPQANENTLVLTAKFDSSFTGKMFLVAVDSVPVNLDSADIVNGEFTLTASLEYPRMLYLRSSQGGRPVPFFADNGEMSVEWLEMTKPPVFKGNPYQDSIQKLTEIEQASRETMGLLGPAYNEAKAAGDEETMKNIEAQADVIRKKMDRQTIEFGKRNGVLGARVVLDKLWDVDAATLDSVYQNIPVNMKNAPATKELKARIDGLKRVSKGAPLVDLVMQDTSGNTLQLSTIQDKFVLVDFWASWCGPCRQVNPELVEIYSDFHDKGFEIIGVSFDTDGNQWKKAIKDDGLIWPQMSDLKGWQTAAASEYVIRAIPQNVLVNQYGVITERNLSVEELRAYLEDALN